MSRSYGFAFSIWTTLSDNDYGENPPNNLLLTVWYVPYWSIVIPLTLLSAYLLLSKPRGASPKNASEPMPAEGALQIDSEQTHRPHS